MKGDTTITNEPPTRIARTVIKNSDNYQEVSLPYRIFRSKRLQNQPIRQHRLKCPMVDASRSTATYRASALATTKKTAIVEWVNAFGEQKPLLFLIVAYLSGPSSKILRNIISQSFREDELNTGLISKIKGSTNTGILEKGYFDQATFDAWVCSVHTDLQGKTLDEKILYSSEFDTRYMYDTDVAKLLNHNMENNRSGGMTNFFGKLISTFEMKILLLGILAQPIKTAEGEPRKAMLIRDLFDFYKYGWFPAPIEDNFIQAGFIEVPD